MARKSDGWVKIHSKILKADLTPSQFKFFVGSILLANPLTAKDPGLVDLSARQLAEELQMSHVEVWRKEQELSKRDMITILNKGFQITNYAYYQGDASVTHTKQQSPPQSVTPTKQAVTPTKQAVTPTKQAVTPAKQSVTNLVPKQTPKKEEVLRSIKKKEKATPTVSETEILNILRQLTGWSYKEEEDIAWLREFMCDYPGFSVAQAKACRDYYSGRAPPKHKGIWKNRLRNWMTKEQEFEMKGGKEGEQRPRQERAKPITYIKGS